MVAYVDVSTYIISLLMCHLIWTLGLLSCASWPLPSDTGPLICSLSALIETSYRCQWAASVVFVIAIVTINGWYAGVQAGVSLW